MISKESLEKFKRLYEKRFGEELSDQVALDKATRLLNLYRAVYAPDLIEPEVKSRKRKINYNRQKGDFYFELAFLSNP